MLRFSSQTIHDIMFPDDRLRQTFFFFFFLLGIRVQNMAISFFQAPIIQKMDSAIHRIKSYPIDNIRWLAIYPVDSAISTIWTTAREQMCLLIPNWSGKNL